MGATTGGRGRQLSAVDMPENDNSVGTPLPSSKDAAASARRRWPTWNESNLPGTITVRWATAGGEAGTEVVEEEEEWLVLAVELNVDVDVDVDGTAVLAAGSVEVRSKCLSTPLCKQDELTGRVAGCNSTGHLRRAMQVVFRLKAGNRTGVGGTNRSDMTEGVGVVMVNDEMARETVRRRLRRVCT